MDWLRDIEINDLLDGDAELIAESCGIDFLIELWKHFPKISLYISNKPLTRAKKRYIKKFYDGKNAKKLAKVLGCSENFIYQTIAKKGKSINAKT